ncbi:acyl-CoA dehydrogenase family protein [Myxococcota bacterium]|nr:acyl-CoA dehydrogenase family protein [Myxococcota bacterium]
MDFGIEDELHLLVETAALFGAQQLTGHERMHERQRGIASSLHRAYAEIGLMDLETPDSLDGAALGALAKCLVNEELAACDVGAAIALDGVGPALYPALEFEGVAAIARLQELCQGPNPKRAVLIHEEIDRDPRKPISLFVDWVPAEEIAAVMLLGPTRACLVTEGIETRSLHASGLRASGASSLNLDHVMAADHWTDPVAASRAHARSRLWVASMMLGVLRATCEFSRRYAGEREAFGKPIAHHQGLAFLIVEMNMALEASRLLVHEAAWRIDQGEDATLESASALIECIESARWVGPSGVQILGGHGFMADYPVEKHMRELRTLGLMAGGLDAALVTAGRELEVGIPPLDIAMPTGEGR